MAQGTKAPAVREDRATAVSTLAPRRASMVAMPPRTPTPPRVLNRGRQVIVPGRVPRLHRTPAGMRRPRLRAQVRAGARRPRGLLAGARRQSSDPGEHLMKARP